jgi:hypothetical protein
MKTRLYRARLCCGALALAALWLDAPTRAADNATWRPFLGGGLTVGGSTIATVYYRNGDYQDLHAGGLVAVYGGLDYRVADRFSLQGTFGYHADGSSGRNGRLTFSRYPLEFLGHYHVTPHIRVGGGVRYVIDPRLSGGGVLSDQGVAFKNTFGGVLEGEYLLFGDQRSGVGFKLRFVSERYTDKTLGASSSGDHAGFFASYYF